jgi:CubicO group peptidase (beta-lactamase class C family)
VSRGWIYNNTCYTIFGDIIERVTGPSYDAFVLKNILEPLGISLTNTTKDDGLPNDAALAYRRWHTISGSSSR